MRLRRNGYQSGVFYLVTQSGYLGFTMGSPTSLQSVFSDWCFSRKGYHYCRTLMLQFFLKRASSSQRKKLSTRSVMVASSLRSTSRLPAISSTKSWETCTATTCGCQSANAQFRDVTRRLLRRLLVLLWTQLLARKWEIRPLLWRVHVTIILRAQSSSSWMSIRTSIS